MSQSVCLLTLCVVSINQVMPFFRFDYFRPYSHRRTQVTMNLPRKKKWRLKIENWRTHSIWSVNEGRDVAVFSWFEKPKLNPYLNSFWLTTSNDKEHTVISCSWYPTHIIIPVFQVKAECCIQAAYNRHDCVGIIRCHPYPRTDGKTETNGRFNWYCSTTAT